MYISHLAGALPSSHLWAAASLDNLMSFAPITAASYETIVACCLAHVTAQSQKDAITPFTLYWGRISLSDLEKFSSY